MEPLNMSIDEDTGKPEVTTDINITGEEEKIFDTLLEVAKLNSLNTTIRVNGGWVRDKMLHKDSKDIDFALDDISGAEFAGMLSKHLYPGEKEKFGVIKANSEKSKHLETATLKVHGQFIDLVNLRCEEYADDSRVPEIKIGTPLQDALRRDLTINSMFYNINEKKIEDFTEKGIDDLREGIIRTPLEPLQTFLDDPLRILRTIRFATRFGFKIVDDIHEAIAQPGIKEALAKKVTFERIGRETDLMLSGENPEDSIEYFHRYQIFSHLLKFPSTCEPLQSEEAVNEYTFESLKICKILGKLFKEIKANTSFMGIEWLQGDQLKEFQRNLFYSAILVPFRSYEYSIKKGKKLKQEKVHSYVMYESLKQPNKSKNFAAGCLDNLDRLIELANQEHFNTLEIGLFVKQLGDLVHPTILLAICLESFGMYFHDPEAELEKEKIDEFVEKYQQFYAKMIEAKVNNAHKIKPLLNGKDLMTLYHIKGGAVLKILVEEVFKWQILNPDGTKDDLSEYMLSKKDEFINR
ncbi:unnamed protein product [Moneuplotes crassus]|uniref:Poly A polymerase head domain-containing protein n=2 Tax=Euplotes crassus TaxID=5936 RepID=A0AAD1UBL3_EUPCR|nr:unnamed protein product [Moneuplotes crassus]